jgi:arylsulfatase
MAVYAAMIDRIDQNIGKLLERLKLSGKLDNTLILFSSDNGFQVMLFTRAMN